MLTEFNNDMDIISALSDTPGLPANELKAKFDDAGKAIKQYINSNLVPAVNAVIDSLDDIEDELNTVPQVADSLSENDSSKALSAKQGKALYDALSAQGSRISSLESGAVSMNTLLGGKQKTISCGTADPSGGVSGDIYIKY